MTFESFVKTWNQIENEETEVDLKKDDLFFKVGCYYFVVQKQSSNILLRKIGSSAFTIFDAFRAFRFFLMKNNVQFIRVEGTLRRYNFLQKMFPYMDVRRDSAIENRNVFYIKVY